MSDSAAPETREGAMHPAPPASGGRPPSRLQCMQVWGGSHLVDDAVSTTGLDVWLFSKPYRNHGAGGDVYYLSSCSSGRITRLVLADVRGHGDGVASLAKALRGLLQIHINHISQRKLVRAINREFTSVGDPTTFATGLVLTFFLPTNRLSLTNAGHPPPLFFCAKDGRWRPLLHAPQVSGPTNVPLGIFEKAEYTELNVQMEAGDLLFCFTDGVDECVDASGEPLGHGGIQALVDGMRDLRPEQIIPALVQRLRALSPANLSDDDATMMIVRPNGAAVSLRNNLLAPFRYLAGLLGIWDHREIPSAP